MNSTNYVLKKSFTEPGLKNCELLEITNFRSSKQYFLVTDWATGLHMFEIITNPFNNKNQTFNRIDYRCPRAQDRNISGLCVLPDTTRLFLLFNDSHRSKIVEFEFNPESNLLTAKNSLPIDHLNPRTEFYDLKLFSASRFELAFLQRKCCSALHIVNYDSHQFESSLDIKKVLNENGFKEPGTRSFEIIEEKYMFLPDYEYIINYHGYEKMVGNNCVHMFKIECLGNQNYSITYLSSFCEETFRCSFYIRKLSNVNVWPPIHEISVLDWLADCIHVYRFNPSNETVNCVAKKTFDGENDKINENRGGLYPVVFCPHENVIYLTRLLHKPGFNHHKHYVGQNEIYVYQHEMD